MASTRCRGRVRTVLIGACALALAAMLAGFVGKGALVGAGASRVNGCPSAGEGSGSGQDASSWDDECELALPSDLEAGLTPEEGTLSERVVDKDLPDAAAALLAEYGAEPGTLLARSGWLDLVGRVWGCVVMGPGWVDVCLLSDGQSDGRTRVKTLRMEVSEWRDSYAGGQEAP